MSESLGRIEGRRIGLGIARVSWLGLGGVAKGRGLLGLASWDLNFCTSDLELEIEV